MKKTFKIIVFTCIVFLIIFFTVTGGGIYNQKATGIGYSDTIEESKHRDVFIKELEHKIIPDSIKLVSGITFFIEKGYRYGKHSTDDTDSLNINDEYKYQICRSPAIGDLFTGEYLLGYGDGRFNVIKDTFRYEIITKVPAFDSIYKVGELILFDKK